MKRGESADSSDGFPVRFSAPCLKVGEEKIAAEARQNGSLRHGSLSQRFPNSSPTKASRLNDCNQDPFDWFAVVYESLHYIERF